MDACENTLVTSALTSLQNVKRSLSRSFRGIMLRNMNLEMFARLLRLTVSAGNRRVRGFVVHLLPAMFREKQGLQNQDNKQARSRCV